MHSVVVFDILTSLIERRERFMCTSFQWWRWLGLFLNNF